MFCSAAQHAVRRRRQPEARTSGWANTHPLSNVHLGNSPRATRLSRRIVDLTARHSTLRRGSAEKGAWEVETFSLLG